ncbi:MAG TPA: DUF4198 domain-containing protein [Dokdonella sp.]
MKTLAKAALFALAASFPLLAAAHKAFLLPSATVLSDGDDAWITVDAAVSNDLFEFNHFPLALDGLAITAPDGARVEPENVGNGKWRNTFDVHLTHQGTYKIAVSTDGAFATYEDANGEKKRARGDAATIAQRIPAGAKNVEITQAQNTVETFVTLGKPNDLALKPSGRGLEFVPVTAPNDLFAGETASFRFLLDGKPAAGIKVSAIRGGTRYRDAPDELTATTDADGKFSLTWPVAGPYWLSASTEGGTPTLANAKTRRAGCTVTLDVLP